VKTSGSALFKAFRGLFFKAEKGPKNHGRAVLENYSEEKNDDGEENSRSPDRPIHCDWASYPSEQEFPKEVLSKPQFVRIISRGYEIVPV